MPQRFLRPGITTSERWNSISFEAQSFFIRILTLVDDFGRYDARLPILHGQCFALRPDIKAQRMAALRSELQTSKLIEVYEVEGREYLQIAQWQERARSDKSKFPINSQVVDISTPAADGSVPQPNPASIDHRPSPIAITSSTSGADEAKAKKTGIELFVIEWNSLPSPFPKVQVMSSDRQTHLRNRMMEVFWRDNWKAALIKMITAEFCCGKNDRTWIADVDFFLKPGTVAKILEGKYDHAQRPATHSGGTPNRNANTLNAGKSSQYAQYGARQAENGTP